MDTENILTFIRNNLSYNKHTGELRWLTDRASGKIKAGSLAGSTSKGYLQIRIYGKWYKAHRLVWLLETGEFPSDQIDHVNRNKKDNRFENLRDTSNYINCLNRTRKSSSGLVGVTYDKVRNQWLAQTYIEGKLKNLGRFDTAEKAHQVYLEVNAERLK